MDESIGQKFRGEVLRYPTVSEKEVPRESGVVTPKVNFTSLVFYRTVFNNILSMYKIDEYV